MSYTIAFYKSKSLEKYDYAEFENRVDICKQILVSQKVLTTNQKEAMNLDLEQIYDTTIDHIEELRDELDCLYDTDSCRAKDEIDNLEEEINKAEYILKSISQLLDYF